MSLKNPKAVLFLIMIVAMLAMAGCPAATPPRLHSPQRALSSATGSRAEPATGPQVGIVLPTKDEPRWLQDEARFKELLATANVPVEILFSQGDSAKEKANVESLLTKGVKVIILTPQDGAAAAAAADAARAAGVKVISYDRLILGTDAVDYYVTFDSNAVGAAQAQYLVDKATGTGNPLYLYAGAASDNNAFLFFEGAWKVLQPKIADGTFVIKNSAEAIALQDKATLTRDEMAKIIGQITTNWDFNTAKNLAEVQPDRRHGGRQGQRLHPRPQRRHRALHCRYLRRRQGCHQLRRHRPGCREGLRPVHHRRQAVDDRPQGHPHAGPGCHHRCAGVPERRDPCSRRPPTTTRRSMCRPSRPR